MSEQAKRGLRIAPDPEAAPVDNDDAMAVAQAAWLRARTAQAVLTANLRLSEELLYPGGVSYTRVKNIAREAEAQVARARDVADALTDCLEAFHSTKPGSRR